METDDIQRKLDRLYGRIPRLLADRPDAQKRCFEHLRRAEQDFAANAILDCRMALADIDVELTVVKRQRFATLLTFLIVYAGAMLWVFAMEGVGAAGMTALTDGKMAGVPDEIWMWAALGTSAAMLMRVGNYDFQDRNQAIRWAITRPVLGLVMGAIVFLSLRAGMLVMAGPDTAPVVPEMLWLCAFVCGFSDTLSVSVLTQLQEKLGGGADGAGGTRMVDKDGDLVPDAPEERK
jgi:hypothetical protein